jgi:hypothetical protein
MGTLSKEAVKIQQNRLELIRLAAEILYIRVNSLRHLDYSLQANIFNSEFPDLHTNGRELYMCMCEPTISEESEDLQLTYQNITTND